MAPLSSVEEVYAEPPGFSHWLSVLGQMSVRETSETFLELSTVLELFVALSRDKEEVLEGLDGAGDFRAMHVAYWPTPLMSSGGLGVGSVVLEGVCTEVSRVDALGLDL